MNIMFSIILNHGFQEHIEKEALTLIKEERDKYSIVYNTIENYCSNNKIIISNMYVLTNQQENKNNIIDKIYRLYCVNPLIHANELTNSIYKQTDGKLDKCKFTKMKTVKEQEEFLIEFDTRIVAIIYDLQQKGRVNERSKIIKPVEINKILYMPPEIEIIDVYQILYDPSKFKDFKQYLYLEEYLYSKVSERKNYGIIGGDELLCRNKKKELLELFKLELLKLVKQLDIIIVGIWGHNIFQHRDKYCADNEKLQIMGNYTCDFITNIVKKELKKHTNFEVSVRKHSLLIPKDFRTLRYTYSIHMITNLGIVEKPFMDFFNCCQFELVPYSLINGFKIGNAYVMLRFFMIDLWILNIIKHLNQLPENVVKSKIERILNAVEHIRNNKDLLLDNEYLGKFQDYNIYKKIVASDEKKFRPYYPYEYQKNNNSLRVIKR